MYDTREEQDIVSNSLRLIQNAIICWNYLYFSDKLAKETDENYCHSANATFLKIDPLPEGSDKLFKMLLLKGKVQREEEVQEIIGKKKPIVHSL